MLYRTIEKLWKLRSKDFLIDLIDYGPMWFDICSILGFIFYALQLASRIALQFQTHVDIQFFALTKFWKARSAFECSVRCNHTNTQSFTTGIVMIHTACLDANRAYLKWLSAKTATTACVWTAAHFVERAVVRKRWSPFSGSDVRLWDGQEWTHNRPPIHSSFKSKQDQEAVKKAAGKFQKLLENMIKNDENVHHQDREPHIEYCFYIKF